MQDEQQSPDIPLPQCGRSGGPHAGGHLGSSGPGGSGGFTSGGEVPDFGTIKPDPELIAQGWERRHTVEPSRAQESVELYESMGFEVKVTPLKPDQFGPICQSCAAGACDVYVMIYTRRKSGTA